MFKHIGSPEIRPRGRRPGWRAWLLAVLLLGLATQMSGVASRKLGTTDPVRKVQLGQAAPLALGDTLRSLAGTVVYAFDSECEHSHAVAPAWAEHFAAAPTTPRLRRLAVTLEDSETAARYSKRFGWHVEVLGTAQLPLGGLEVSLVNRTPWLFVFDFAGVLRYQGHGADLERMEAVARSIAG